jgi:hypothetical protein
MVYSRSNYRVDMEFTGGVAFALEMMITPEILAGLPEAQRELYVNIPLWVTVTFAVAVFAGAFGSLFLLMKKSPSTPFRIFSL